MPDRFPQYDVLAKRYGPSWNATTRSVIEARLALSADPSVLGPERTETLCAVVGRIVPQPAGRAPVNAAALVIDKIARDAGDGHRPEHLPRTREAWMVGLDAIEAEAQARHDYSFAALDGDQADTLLRSVENGSASHPAWGYVPSAAFWRWRLLPDIVGAYYAHPSAWSAMGFGGPAAPRGYVRMGANRRDGWEAVERQHAGLISAARRNRNVR